MQECEIKIIEEIFSQKETSDEAKFLKTDLEISELECLVKAGKRLNNEEQISLNEKKQQLSLLKTQLENKQLSSVRFTIVKKQAESLLKVIENCVDDTNGNKLSYGIYVRRIWHSQVSSGYSRYFGYDDYDDELDDELKSFRLKNKEKCHQILTDFIDILKNETTKPQNFIALNSLMKDFHEKVFEYTDFSVT